MHTRELQPSTSACALQFYFFVVVGAATPRTAFIMSAEKAETTVVVTETEPAQPAAQAEDTQHRSRIQSVRGKPVSGRTWKQPKEKYGSFAPSLFSCGSVEFLRKVPFRSGHPQLFYF
jgi:hypothetical protein